MAAPSPKQAKLAEGFDFASQIFDVSKERRRKPASQKASEKLGLEIKKNSSSSTEKIDTKNRTSEGEGRESEKLNTNNDTKSVQNNKSDKCQMGSYAEEMTSFKEEMIKIQKQAMESMLETLRHQPNVGINKDGRQETRNKAMGASKRAHVISESSDDDIPLTQTVHAKKQKMTPILLEMDVGEQVDEFLAECGPSKQDDSDKSDGEIQSDFEELLQNEYSTSEEKTGKPVSDKVSEIINKLYIGSLSEDRLKDILEKYPRPQNIEIHTPRINGEIWKNINSTTRSNDIKYKKIADRIIHGSYALSNLVDKLILFRKDGDKKMSTENITNVVKVAMDAITLFGQSYQLINQRRREAIKPDLNKKFDQLCSVNIASELGSSKLLFGDELGKRIKDLKEVNLVSSNVATHKSQYGPYPKHYTDYNRPGMRKPFLGNRRGRQFFPNKGARYSQSKWTNKKDGKKPAQSSQN